MVGPIGRRSSTPRPAVDQTPDFETKKSPTKQSLTINGHKIKLVSNGVTKRRPENTTPARTEKERELGLLRNIAREVHPALADTLIKFRPGFLGNEYFRAKITRNLDNGHYDFKLEYSPLGQKRIDEFRRNPTPDPEG
jgi:hypothetical protein